MLLESLHLLLISLHRPHAIGQEIFELTHQTPVWVLFETRAFQY